MAIVHETTSYLSVTSGLSTINIHKFDSESDNLVASGCLPQKQLNLTRHVVTVFAYNEEDGLIVGPPVILQKKRFRSTNIKGKKNCIQVSQLN